MCIGDDDATCHATCVDDDGQLVEVCVYAMLSVHNDPPHYIAHVGWACECQQVTARETSFL